MKKMASKLAWIEKWGMRIKPLLLTLFAFLFSCSFDSGNDNSPKAEGKLFGWRSAGLTPNADSLYTWGNGLLRIEHSNEYIFVIDATVSNPSTLEPASRIFMSKQGSEIWEEMQMPSGVNPFNMYADSSGLYVGTYRTGQLWHYNPSSNTWKNLEVFELKSNMGLTFYCISRLGGNLVVSMAGFGDWATQLYEEALSPIMLQNADGTWENISPPKFTEPETMPLYFHNAKEFNGDLIVLTSYKGVWRYSVASREWVQIPHPTEINGRGRINECYRPLSMSVYKGKLYVGQYNNCGIYTLNGDLNSWEKVDSSRVEYEVLFIDGPDDFVKVDEPPYDWDNVARIKDPIYSNTPFFPEAMVSNGRYLFSAGRVWINGPPVLYMGESGEPKGWRIVDREGWCSKDFYKPCRGTETYGLDIVGDTLYAANWKGLHKFPLSDLDSAIAGEKPYP